MRFLTWKEQLGRSIQPYMERWVINFGLFSIRLHHWFCSDDHRNKHDHSWNFITIVLKGGYTDITEDGKEEMPVGTIRFRPANHIHTTNVWPDGCWTIVITGPIIRQWGFWVNGKFFHRTKYFWRYGHHQCE